MVIYDGSIWSKPQKIVPDNTADQGGLPKGWRGTNLAAITGKGNEKVVYFGYLSGDGQEPGKTPKLEKKLVHITYDVAHRKWSEITPADDEYGYMDPPGYGYVSPIGEIVNNGTQADNPEIWVFRPYFV
ncbi:hypothetical protein DDJ45_10300 [Mycobacteroides abscessus]|nr:hypothetical protein DDJ45_10300 [Mycobacteroides abscessus]